MKRVLKDNQKNLFVGDNLQTTWQKHNKEMENISNAANKERKSNYTYKTERKIDYASFVQSWQCGFYDGLLHSFPGAKSLGAFYTVTQLNVVTERRQ